MKTKVTARKAKDVRTERREALQPPLGVHVSVAGGLQNAFAEGIRVGCDCVQIFVKNQRQWRSKPLTDEQVTLFRAAQRESGIAPVIAHANYLLNLASPVEFTRKMSIEVLADELSRCEALGIVGLVLHPGAHLGGDQNRDRATDGNQSRKRELAVRLNSDREGAGRKLPIADFQLPIDQSRERKRVDDSSAVLAGIERIAASLDEVHARCAGFKSMILLETTAGQGTSIGWRFEELRGIVDRVAAPERLGVCLDTCHLFAAGYDIRTPESYAATMEQLDSAIGVSRVKCIHVNDSKRELGSRVDRHEHIGKGKIGKQGFANFLNDPRWCDTPMILETPKEKDGRGTDFDKVNLKRLRGLVPS